MDYKDFLSTKIKKAQPCGFDPGELNEHLFDFQRAIVRWAIKKGRCAIFAGTGLGKSLMLLEWANKYYEHTGKPILVFSPLAVSNQTKREGDKFHISIPHEVVSCDAEIIDGINITNYEKLHRFTDPSKFGAIVIDAAGILKGFDGKFRKAITEFAKDIPFRLICTATPAPNDYMEIGMHSEFLGVMPYTEMLAMYFTHDGGETQKWVVKKHGEKQFWNWVCSWGCCISHPRDLGFPTEGYDLPHLNVIDIKIETEPSGGSLFPVEAESLSERINARKDTVVARCQADRELVLAHPDESWVIWTNLNAESDMVHKGIPGSVEVKGSDSETHKEKSMMGFVDGSIKYLVSKPSIFGHGANWQHCNNMVYVGLTDSWEAVFQSQRRLWRFGQTKPVNCYMISADVEGNVIENLQRKEDQFRNMVDHMVSLMKDEMVKEIVGKETFTNDFNETMEIPTWLTCESN